MHNLISLKEINFLHRNFLDKKVTHLIFQKVDL